MSTPTLPAFSPARTCAWCWSFMVARPKGLTCCYCGGTQSRTDLAKAA